MNRETLKPLALVVRQAPYAQRSARSQLDFALAAAALELPLEVYFLGEGVWQLVTEREASAAGLPRGLKGWAAIATMTEVSFFGESDQLQLMQDNGVETLVPVEGLTGFKMANRWQSCSQVLSL